MDQQQLDQQQQDIKLKLFVIYLTLYPSTM